jgi:hypothetical protein
MVVIVVNLGRLSQLLPRALYYLLTVVVEKLAADETLSSHVSRVHHMVATPFASPSASTPCIKRTLERVRSAAKHHETCIIRSK